jgi:LysM repeat protein
MPQSLIIILLLFVFVLPILGAVILRLLISRLEPVQLYGAAAALLGLVIASVLVLARSDIPSLQIGNLSVLLPVTAPNSSSPQRLPNTPAEQPPALPDAATSAPVTATATLSATVLPSATATVVSPTAAATQTATAVPTATSTATPEPTAIPPTAIPPTTAPAPAAPRTYTVQPGDTLLSIAEEFNTTVTAIIEANNLTPQQADSLRVGQKLVIP